MKQKYKEKIKKLIKLYNVESKHSHYQRLPTLLEKIIPSEYFPKSNKFERERFNYIINNLEFKGNKILEIGCNTVFFTFEVILSGASRVECYEGNKTHYEFVKIAAEILELSDKINIINKYFDYKKKNISEKYDIGIVLNVLHHIGDDFERDDIVDKNYTLNRIKNSLNNLSFFIKYLIFQMGSNWKGKITLPLFKNVAKKEMIEFIKKSTIGFWEVVKIGIPEIIGDKIVYQDLSTFNIRRDDSLGEFLNRPLFILKSKEEYK
jgi:hypothetical protein